jgi:small multidrug resistance pump
MTAASLIAVLGIAILTVGGDYLLKIASQQEQMFRNVHFVCGAAIYALGAFGWTLAFRHMKMASVGAIYSTITVVLLVLLGMLAFRERLSGSEILGVMFALASIVLLLRHA